MNIKHLNIIAPLAVLLTLAIGFMPSSAEATPAPLVTVVTHDLTPGDDLPMFNGNLDSVKFETLSGSTYEWARTSDVGPCVYDVDLWGDVQLVVDALGGELYALERWQPSVPFVGTGPTTLDTGVLTEDVTDSVGRTITSDTRCDNFEGTGTITLSWAAKTAGGVSGTGCNFGPQTAYHDLTDVTVRVTYTSH